LKAIVWVEFCQGSDTLWSGDWWSHSGLRNDGWWVSDETSEHQWQSSHDVGWATSHDTDWNGKEGYGESQDDWDEAAEDVDGPESTYDESCDGSDAAWEEQWGCVGGDLSWISEGELQEGGWKDDDGDVSMDVASEGEVTWPVDAPGDDKGCEH
jgi:hypothetical protein